MARIGRIGTRIGFEGQEEYRNAVNEINNSMKNLASEMKAVTYEFGRNDKSVEGLTKRKGILEQQTVEQQKAIDAAREALKKLEAEGLTPTDKAYQDMERVLRENESAMNGAKREIGELDKALQESKVSWQDVGSVVADVGKAITVAMATVGAAAIAAGAYMYGMAKETAAAGNAINDYSQRMGMSRTAIQEWDYILSQNGATLGNLNYGMRRVVAAMGSLDEEGGKVGKAITRLGLDFDEVRRKSPEDAMNAVVAAFQHMEEGADKTALALEIFGQNGGVKLAPLLNSTAAATDELRQRAHDLGMVMTDDAITAAADFTNSLDTLGRTFDGIKNAIGAELLPGFTMISDGLIGLISGSDDAAEKITAGVEEVVRGISDAIPKVLDLFHIVATTIAEIAPEIITALVGGIVDNIPKLIDATLAIVTALVEGVITALPKLLDGAIQIIRSLSDGIVRALPTLIPTIVDVIVQIVNTLIDNIPLLIDAALQLLVGLAKGIIDAIPVIIEAIPTLINSLVSAILESIPLIIQAGADLLIALVGALPEIIVAIVAAIPEIVQGIMTAINENIPLIIQSGIDLIVSLVTALPEIIMEIVKAIPEIIAAIIQYFLGNIPLIIEMGIQLFIALVSALPLIIVEIVKAVPEIVKSIIEGFEGFIPNIVEMGKDLISGLIKGLLDSVGRVVDAVKDVGERILGGIRGFFGINSPSTVFAEIGENLAEGLGVGFDREAKDVEKTMIDVMGKAGETTATEAMNKISQGITSAIKDVTSVVPQVAQAIITAFTAEHQSIKQAGQDLNRQVAAGLTASIPDVTAIVPQITQAIITAFTAEHQSINQAGQDINRQIAQGMTTATPQVTAVVQDIIQAIYDAITAAHPQFNQSGQNIMQQLAQGITGAAQEATQAVTTVINQIVQTVQNAVSQFQQAGQDMASGIATGFSNGSSSMRQSILAEIDRLVRDAQARLQIESPSKVFAKIGENMAKGLGLGFTEEMRDVKRAVDNAVGDMIPDPATHTVIGRDGQVSKQGGFVLNQNIYTRETNYAAQQREAGRNFKLIAREVGAV